MFVCILPTYLTVLILITVQTSSEKNKLWTFHLGAMFSIHTRHLSCAYISVQRLFYTTHLSQHTSHAEYSLKCQWYSPDKSWNNHATNSASNSYPTFQLPRTARRTKPTALQHNYSHKPRAHTTESECRNLRRSLADSDSDVTCLPSNLRA
jgi:hypothetical protein